MKILVLHGPNLNLIGLKSSQTGDRYTLDKINKKLKQDARGLKIRLKIYQTHKTYMAISFLQQNRKLYSGLLLAPSSWAKYEYSILETLKIIGLPFVQILLDQKKEIKNSIFSSKAIYNIYDSNPTEAFLKGLKTIEKHLS